jgi:hypothetical protein
VSSGTTVVPMGYLCDMLSVTCPLTVRVTHQQRAPVKHSHSEKFVP